MEDLCLSEPQGFGDLRSAWTRMHQFNIEAVRRQFEEGLS
jgi:hypothetical protein